MSSVSDQFASLRETIQSTQGAQRGEAGNAAPPGRRHRRKGTKMVPTPTTAPSAGSNMIPFAELLSVAESFGALEGKTKDAQAKWDLKLVEAAHSGAIDLTKDKHGPGKDDAFLLSEAYFKGRNANVIFDHREPRQQKLMSTNRLAIRYGGTPKFGVNQPVANTNDFVTMRQKILNSPRKAGQKMEDLHNALMNLFRAQLKRDTLITGDELKSYCFKPGSELRTAEEVLNTIKKLATNLKDGKVVHCPDSDNSNEVAAIISNCTKRLAAIARGKTGTQQAA